MPRRPRNFQLYQPHHICQRANARRTLFHSPSDYETYLSLWRAALDAHRLRLWGFCLMPNHVHFLVAPSVEAAIPTAMNVVQSSFSRILNAIHNTPGHRWVQRYFASACSPVYAWVALAYIENNPVRAHLAPSPDLYPYSSAPHHLALHDPLLPLDTDPWSALFDPPAWRSTLARCAQKHLWNERLRVATKAGIPFSETLPDRLDRYYSRPDLAVPDSPITLDHLLAPLAQSAP
jgi:putative transposase